MKTYKVNGIIVKGNTCLDAISKIKDDITSDIPYMLNMAKDYANNLDWQKVANICYSIMDKFKRAKLADSNIKDEIDYDYLLSEERKAVEDYRKSINETTNKNELYVLSHILKEETHHIELLENLQKGKVEFNDSGKCFYTQRRGIIYVYIDYNLVGRFSSKKEAIDAGYDIDGAIKFNANYETK